MPSNRVFVSYSHSDRKWRDQLDILLAPVIGSGEIDFWHDGLIPPGADWRETLERALVNASTGVVLVTPHLLASKFVNEVELPYLTQRAAAGDLTLLWVAISASLVQQTPLAKLQALNDPKRPLDQLRRPQRDAELARIAEKIVSGLTLSSLARAFETVDASSDQLATAAGRPDRQRPHSVIAHHTGQAIEFWVGGRPTAQRITYDEISRLSQHEQRLIRAYERAMYGQFELWTELYGRQPHLTPDEAADMFRTGQSMCGNLRRILEFLERLGKHLDDHYWEVRQICAEVSATADQLAVPPG